MPSQKRLARQQMMKRIGVSERRACRLIQLARSTARYERKHRDDGAGEALRALAQKHPGVGYPQLHQRMRRAGWKINRKRVYRLYKSMNLNRKSGKRRVRGLGTAGSAVKPSQANQVWAMDFMADRLNNGQSYRLFTAVDCFTRECLTIAVGSSMSAVRVVRVLSGIAAVRGLPQTIVCDNGPEFRAYALRSWADRNGVQIHYIDPGRPTQNSFIESFNATVRAECLELRSVDSIAEARNIVAAWREDYNQERPHGSIGNMPPGAFARFANWTEFRGILDTRATRSDNGLMENWKTLNNAFPTFPQAPPLPTRNETEIGVP